MFRARADTCVRGGTTNSTCCGWMGAFHLYSYVVLLAYFALRSCPCLFGCPSLFLVLGGLLFAGVFIFDVCLAWLVSFFLSRVVLHRTKKGERGRGQSPGGYSSGFVSPSGPKDPTGTCGVTNARHRRGRTTPAHEFSGKQQQPTAGFLRSLRSRTCFCGAWRGWAVGEARGVWPKFGEGGQAR